jgi:hypothetical protein
MYFEFLPAKTTGGFLLQISSRQIDRRISIADLAIQLKSILPTPTPPP